jgi:hypothetical protein
MSSSLALMPQRQMPSGLASGSGDFDGAVGQVSSLRNALDLKNTGDRSRQALKMSKHELYRLIYNIVPPNNRRIHHSIPTIFKDATQALTCEPCVSVQNGSRVASTWSHYCRPSCRILPDRETKGRSNVARGMSPQEFAHRGHGLNCIELLLQTGFEDVSQNAQHHAPKAINAANNSQTNTRRKLERAGMTCNDCDRLICQDCVHRLCMRWL